MMSQYKIAIISNVTGKDLYVHKIIFSLVTRNELVVEDGRTRTSQNEIAVLVFKRLGKKGREEG